VDPLVFQTYKTVMCFLTSWMLIPLGQPFFFSYWGIVSGLFWVPGGIAAIYAVQNAGLAVAQGVWSSMIVLVSFIWGIFVFQEGVESVLGACLSVLLMVIGLWGMSFYSSPDLEANTGGGYNSSYHRSEQQDGGQDDDDYEGNLNIDNLRSSSDEGPMAPSMLQCYDFGESGDANNEQIRRRRYKGLLAAMTTGTWGGSIMVPMHYAPEDASGMGYVISFGIGASVVTLAVWIGRLFYLFYLHRSMKNAFNALPSFHFKVMWKQGFTAGILWSMGNMSSMVSVQYLGEGVGYSITQASMLISGLWGIFYFEEVKNKFLRMKWLLAACVTIAGILFLSYMHVDEEYYE